MHFKSTQFQLRLTGPSSGIVTEYDETDLGQHWLWQLLVAWRYHAIIWTTVDLSAMSSDNLPRAISQKIPQSPMTKIMKITWIKFHLNIPGCNGLTIYFIAQSIVQRFGCQRDVILRLRGSLSNTEYTKFTRSLKQRLTCIHNNKVCWLCLVPTSTTSFASDVGYRMAKI